MTVANLRRTEHHRLCALLEGQSGLAIMNSFAKRVETRVASWITDQELAVIIGLIVLIFVSWGIYPLLNR